MNVAVAGIFINPSKMLYAQGSRPVEAVFETGHVVKLHGIGIEELHEKMPLMMFLGDCLVNSEQFHYAYESSPDTATTVVFGDGVVLTLPRIAIETFNRSLP